MTREQRQVFLTTAARETPHYYQLFVTLAGTGMRLGEALALQWEDLNLDAQAADNAAKNAAVTLRD